MSDYSLTWCQKQVPAEIKNGISLASLVKISFGAESRT